MKTTLKSFIRVACTLLIMFVISAGSLPGQTRVPVPNQPAAGSNPGVPVEMGGNLYVSASNTSGERLFRCSANGTPVLVADRTCYSYGLSNIGGTLYFASVGSKSKELWKSDGTTQGTVLVKAGDSPGFPFVQAGGTTFFSNRISKTNGGYWNDLELWKTNGSSKGTTKVKTINNNGNDEVYELHDLNGTLLFLANDGTYGLELWKSNGSAAGTVMVKDIHPGAEGSRATGFSYPWRLYPLEWVMQTVATRNGAPVLITTLDDGTGHGAQMWMSDGTVNGTIRVSSVGTNFWPHWYCQVGTDLYFSANNGDSGYELWKFDLASPPSQTNPSQAAEINTGGSSYPMWLTDVGGMLYFTADDGLNGRELWKYDGTATRLTDINVIGGADPNGITMYGNWSAYPKTIANRAGILYFMATGPNGTELYSYDTNNPSAQPVEYDINPGAGSSEPYWFTFVGTSLFFSATDGTHGRELWKLSNVPKQGVKSAGMPVPTAPRLDQNFPNPFGTSTEIRFSMPDDGPVRLTVHDMLGRQLAILVDGRVRAGMQSVSFDAAGLPGGTYIVRLEAGGIVHTRMIMRMK